MPMAREIKASLLLSLTRKISEKAIRELNGKKFQNRELSLDYAHSKEKYQSAVKAKEMLKDFKALKAVEVDEICDEEEENA